MEEEKMTNDTEMNVGMSDEEIVKAFKFCLKDKEGCDKCMVYNKNTPMLRERFIVCEKLVKSALDFIHRLQSDLKTCSNIEKQEKETNAKLRQEIERLTEEANQDTVTHIDICTENFSLRKQNAELQKEVERLMEENAYLKQCGDNFLADYQRAQKQVDELTEERENMQAEIIAMENVRQQAYTAGYEQGRFDSQQEVDELTKDMAKEILVPLIGCEKQIDPLKTGIRWSVLKGFCKKFGVEVE